MELLWTLLIGLAVGIVAKFLMPGRDPGGFIITALLGVAGAFVAHAIGRSMGWYERGTGGVLGGGGRFGLAAAALPIGGGRPR
jgi:uncharacterized membrane protein YeaQ/YmgE (transglycosylase-associated protein family)